MKTKLILIGLLLSTITQAQNIEVLFLGNSYTGVNNLPNLVYQLALSGGDTIQYDANTPGGHTLEGHSTNNTTFNKIFSNDWDYVVLQEQSQRPSFPPSQVAWQVYPYARALDSLITLNNPCTETVFYMTWGRRYGDAMNCPNYPPLCTFEGMSARLRTSYLEMGADNDAIVAPVGAAWSYSKVVDSTMVLHSGDNSHPNMHGSYLAACVFYATMLRKSPLGLSYHSTLSDTDATYLQNIAALTVMDSMDVWYIGAYDPIADFTYGNNMGTVNFNTPGINATSHWWDFGDGNTSNSVNPQHTYTTSGYYVVQHIAYSDCTSDTITDSIYVDLTTNIGNAYNTTDQVVLYPNPGTGNFNMNIHQHQPNRVTITVLDATGRLVLTQTLPIKTQQYTHTFNLTDQPKGVYYLKLETATKAYHQQIVVQ